MSDNAKLRRQTFSTSRELEYFSESELTTQTGCGKDDWWPGVVGKELIDNGLDACEQAGVAPDIRLEFSGDTLTVADNGPGLDPDVLERILDFSSRTSDKAAYVAPTRGAQGNALKTVLAIPYVLGGGQVQIESCGIRHTIVVSTDHVIQRPQIDHQQEPIVRSVGTLIQVTVDAASSQAPEPEPRFLQKLVANFALFNPHAAFELVDDGERTVLEATASDWRKWLPTDPTSAHWYNQERLETLVGCYIGAERDGGRVCSIREFVSEFRGLAGTAKGKQVSEQAGLQRAALHELARDGKFDHQRVADMLAAMQGLSAPVKPEMLGVLGKEHFVQRIQAEGETFRYILRKGTDQRGLPYVMEFGFGMTSPDGIRGLRVGTNWSASLANPFQCDNFALGPDDKTFGMEALLTGQRISMGIDPVCLAIHMACPRFHFLDRGKGTITLRDGDQAGIAELLTEGVAYVTKDWARIKKQQERDRQQADRSIDRYKHGASSRVTVKDAAEAVMEEAYQKASGDGHYPANARQIMYAARPAIQEQTEQTLRDVYFTQTLLPDYVRDYPDETAGWDVVYDARGHLWEPHTGEQIGVGTLEVRQYLQDIDGPLDLDIEAPRLGRTYPTSGPRNRYNGVLYIEKEGFLPLLDRAGFAKRYDLAIMSSKGMGTVAARKLIESLSAKATIFVLHDFDKSGFSIAGTLTRDTRRYEFTSEVTVIDLGLRLVDVKKWQLQSEAVEHKSDPTSNLQENGATAEEVQFLYSRTHGGHHGQRVELNAFTSDQFVAWLDSKLIEHGAAKVIPDAGILEQAYRRAVAVRRYQQLIDEAGDKIANYANGLSVPETLRAKVAKMLTKNPTLAWDEALAELLEAGC